MHVVKVVPVRVGIDQKKCRPGHGIVGRRQEALALFERALALNPTSVAISSCGRAHSKTFLRPNASGLVRRSRRLRALSI
jgi:hypothetical protein